MATAHTGRNDRISSAKTRLGLIGRWTLSAGIALLTHSAVADWSLNLSLTDFQGFDQLQFNIVEGSFADPGITDMVPAPADPAHPWVHRACRDRQEPRDGGRRCRGYRDGNCVPQPARIEYPGSSAWAMV